MIPQFVEIMAYPWPVLPPGIHRADLREVRNRYASTYWRMRLFRGFVLACRSLVRAKCERIYLDGSYVTGKPVPRDYDACWDPDGVDPRLVDPVFNDFANSRAAQKQRFGGEFFHAGMVADRYGQNYLEFFQIARAGAERKGIILIEFEGDPLL